jgi:hypothetical protein
MGQSPFFDFLSNIEWYAFRTIEALVFLTFVSVYGWMAIRHIIALGRKDND